MRRGIAPLGSPARRERRKSGLFDQRTRGYIPSSAGVPALPLETGVISMFSRFGAFVFGMAVGGTLVFGAQRYHVVRTDRGVELVRKLSPGFGETYVDVRNYSAADWAEHPSIAAALMRSGNEHVLQDDAADSIRQELGGLIDGLKRIGEG